MKWLHCDKDDNNDDIMQMKTANKGGNREVVFLRRSNRGIRKRTSIVRNTKRVQLYYYVEKIV